MHSSGSSVVSGTTTAAINRLSQPSRVTTSTMPRIAQETVIAAGTASTWACSISPSATPTKTAGKIRPPRKPLAEASTRAASLTSAMSRKSAAVSVWLKASCCISSSPLNSVKGPPMVPRIPSSSPPMPSVRMGCLRRCIRACRRGRHQTATMPTAIAIRATIMPLMISTKCIWP